MNNSNNTPSFEDMITEMVNNAMDSVIGEEPATEEPVVENADTEAETSEESEAITENDDSDYKDTGIDMDDVQRQLKMESDEDDDDDDDLGDDDDEDDDDDIDDDDLEDMADDIANMSDDDLNDMAHSLKEPPVPEGPEVSLTPDEEQHADDLMQVAGAAALIRGEMNAEERTSLVESVSDLRVGMTEGFFNDSLIMDLKESVADVTMDDDDAFTESKIYNKTTVKMSKKARLNQLFEIAVITCARAHNDPSYMKYKKACKIKKFYRAQMRQRYRSEATKRMKVLFARLKQSKSPIIKSLGKKVD